MNNPSRSECLGEMIVEFTMIMRLGKFFKTVRLLETREPGENAFKASFLESRVAFFERDHYRLSVTGGKIKDRILTGRPPADWRRHLLWQSSVTRIMPPQFNQCGETL